MRDTLTRLNASQFEGHVESSLEACVFTLGRALEALLANFNERESVLLNKTQELEYECKAIETRVMQRAKQDAACRERKIEAALREREREDAERSQQQSICEM